MTARAIRFRIVSVFLEEGDGRRFRVKLVRAGARKSARSWFGTTRADLRPHQVVLVSYQTRKRSGELLGARVRGFSSWSPRARAPAARFQEVATILERFRVACLGRGGDLMVLGIRIRVERRARGWFEFHGPEGLRRFSWVRDVARELVNGERKVV